MGFPEDNFKKEGEDEGKKPAGGGGKKPESGAFETDKKAEPSKVGEQTQVVETPPPVAEPGPKTPAEMQEDPNAVINQDIVKEMAAAKDPALADDYPHDEPKVQNKMRPIGERREEAERELSK